jgi:hypothetical protein
VSNLFCLITSGLCNFFVFWVNSCIKYFYIPPAKPSSASNRSPWAPGGGVFLMKTLFTMTHGSTASIHSLVFQQEVWNSQHLSNTGYLRREVTQLLTRENYRIELRPAWHNYFTLCGQFGKLLVASLQITNSAHQWLPPPPPPATIPLSWEELLIKMLSTVTHE